MSIKTINLNGTSYDVGSTGVSDDLKTALLQLASKATYIDGNGATYYNDLYDALYPSANVTSITAVYTQGGTVYDTDTLNSLKSDLVVTATYDDSTTAVITNYTLSGSLIAGTSTITVSYNGVTTTFNVTVTALVPSGYTICDYVSNETDNTAYLRTDFPTADVDAIDYEFSITCKSITASSEDIPYGGRDSYSGSIAKKGIILYTKTSAIDAHYGNATADGVILQSGGITATPTDKHTYTLKHGKVYIDGTEVHDSGALYVNVSASYKFAMFKRNNGGSYNGHYTGRIYGFTVKDNNDDYVVRYIPCKRDLDDVYGFYDTVSSTFVTAYTSAFTGGNES